MKAIKAKEGKEKEGRRRGKCDINFSCKDIFAIFISAGRDKKTL